MKYYNIKQIAEMTGYKRSKCYSIVKKMNNELKEKYPNQIIFSAKIPIWYWEEKTEPHKVNNNN